MTLQQRIGDLVQRHGSLRSVSRVTGIDTAYLSRLSRGEKTEPSETILRKLGLKRVVTYALILEPRSGK